MNKNESTLSISAWTDRRGVPLETPPLPDCLVLSDLSNENLYALRPVANR